MRISFLPLLIPVLALASLPSAVQAATITWGAPTAETGSPSDISTTGTFFDSATWKMNDVTVNGVRFNGQGSWDSGSSGLGNGSGMHFGNGSKIEVVNLYNPSAAFGVAPNPWDPNYRALVGGGAYGLTPVPVAILLGGLTVGRTYQVQVFEAFWNNNWATRFTGGANSVLLNLTGRDVGAGETTIPDYAIGTFTADATSQIISLSSGTDAIIFNSIQVRSVSVPDVGLSAGMFGLGILGLAVVRRNLR